MDEQSTPAEVPLVGHTVEPVVVRLSDSVTIIRGDCLACLPIEADAVVSDPPYGIDWDTDYRGRSSYMKIWKNLENSACNSTGKELQ